MNSNDTLTGGQPRWLDLFYIPFSVVFIGVGLFITFFHVFSNPEHPRFLLLGDAWVENGPKLFYGDAALAEGEFALWNSLTFCGQPVAANPQYMVFYPPNVLRSLLTPGVPTPMKTHVGINLMIGAHMLLGGFAAYLFARAHRLSGAASVVTAFAFVFSAPMVSRAIGHWQFVVMVSWLPLDLLLLHMGMTAKTTLASLRAYLLLGLVFGTTLLGGSPHFMLLCGLSLGLYWTLSRMADVATAVRTDGPSKAAREHTRPLGRDLVLGAMALAIALAFASPMLLPAAEFSQYSARNDAEGTNEVEVLASEGDNWNVFQRLVVYTGTENYEGIRAAGAGVTMLALLALVFGRRRTVFIFGGMFLVLLDCSLNEPFFFGKIVAFVSPYKMSSPGRAMLVACIPLGMLAGAAIDGLLNARVSTRHMVLRSALSLAAGGIVIATMMPLVHPHPFLDMSELTWVVPLALLGLLILGIWIREPITCGAVVAMLVLGESLVWNTKYIEFSTRPGITYSGDMDALKVPAAFRPWQYRTAHPTPNLNLYTLEPAINGHDPLHMRSVRDVLCQGFKGDAYRRNISPLEVLSLNSRGNQFLKRAFWLSRQAVAGPLPGMNALFPPATTVFLPDPPPELPVPLVPESAVLGSSVSNDVAETIVVNADGPPEVVSATVAEGLSKGIYYGTKQPLPPLHTTATVDFTPLGAAEVMAVFRDQTSHREYYGRIVKLPAMERNRAISLDFPLPDVQNVEIGIVPKFDEPDGSLLVRSFRVRSDRQDEGGKIRVVKRTANTVAVNVDDLPAPRLLTFIDSFYPGWFATLDGAPVPILKADDVFKAVAVPPGSHQIEFAFRPWRVYAGLWAAGLATALALLGAAWSVLRERAGNRNDHAKGPHTTPPGDGA